MDFMQFQRSEYNQLVSEYGSLFFSSLRIIGETESDLSIQTSDDYGPTSSSLLLEVVTLENDKYFLRLFNHSWTLLGKDDRSDESFESFESFANQYSVKFQERFKQRLFDALSKIRQ